MEYCERVAIFILCFASLKISHGKNLNQSAGVKEAKVQHSHCAALFSVRQKAGVYARFRALPDLLSRVRE